MMDKTQLAKFFHKTYEELATGFLYKTREETKEFNPNSANGKLMIATCEAVLEELSRQSKDTEALDCKNCEHKSISNGLALWSEKYPRSMGYHTSMQATMDGELIDMETRAKKELKYPKQ
jgi:hypothetical protein